VTAFLLLSKGLPTVKKNASEIEQYLRKLGTAQFAGAMEKQMATIGGASSNLGDNFIRMQKQIGDSGFNDSVQNLYGSISNVVASSEESAKSLGLALASVTNGVTKVVENIDVLKDATVAFVGFKAMQIGAAATSTAFITMGTAVRTTAASVAFSSAVAGKAATTGIIAMNGLSLAAKGLSASVAMLGGPLGVIAIAGFAIYEFTKKGDAAAKASSKYATELKEIEKNAKGLTTATNELNKATEKGARLKLLDNIDEAKQSIADIQDQIKNTEYSDEGFWSGLFNSDSVESQILKLKTQMNDGKMSVQEFEDTLLQMGETDIKFRDPAVKLLKMTNSLKASELALENYQKKLKELDNPMSIDTKPTLNVEEIQMCVASLEDLNNVGKSSIDVMHSLGMSVTWQDGMIDGLKEVKGETVDFAKTAKDAVTGSFKSMEDGIINFVETGKLSFTDFANTILEGILRIQIQQAIIQPLANGLSGMFSSGTTTASVNHTGGFAGSGPTRNVPIDVFANAPRFHSGGMIRQDEIPAILQKGEMVVPRQKVQAMQRNSRAEVQAPIININVENHGNSQVKTQTSQNANGFNLDIIVEEIEGQVASNISRNRGPVNAVLNQKFKPNGANF